jgi:DedD protein
MAKQTTEEELNLRRQARRRLIGAVALVLLAVFLLPVVFDSDPALNTGNDIELRIPNKENAGEFQPKIDLPELDKMAAEVAAASTAAVTQPAPVEAQIAKEIPPKPVLETAPKIDAKPKAETKPKAESKPVVKQQPVPKTGWVVQVGAFANVDTAKNLQAKLSKQGYHAYTEKAGDVMRVRVGSFSTLDAAEKTKAKLEAQGMPSNVVNLE